MLRLGYQQRWLHTGCTPQGKWAAIVQMRHGFQVHVSLGRVSSRYLGSFNGRARGRGGVCCLLSGDALCGVTASYSTRLILLSFFYLYRQLWQHAVLVRRGFGLYSYNVVSPGQAVLNSHTLFTRDADYNQNNKLP